MKQKECRVFLHPICLYCNRRPERSWQCDIFFVDAILRILLMRWCVLCSLMSVYLSNPKPIYKITINHLQLPKIIFIYTLIDLSRLAVASQATSGCQSQANTGPLCAANCCIHFSVLRTSHNCTLPFSDTAANMYG